MNQIRPIAIYLPQFHPIPENDLWWGKGFTEWTNVAKAKPLFEGHYQPQLPADLGFYDLRLAEVREEQARLAKEYGIYGFCYYHYWFNGRRILERPFQEVFESGKPELPFMLCWANENWTRIWDGLNKNVLLEQKYNEEDDREHIRSLIPYFKDERYIKINGKPLFSIYRSTELPDIERTLAIWRQECLKEGIELYICRFESFGSYGKKLIDSGFNAAVEFQPFSQKLYEYINVQVKKELIDNVKYKLLRRFYKYTARSHKFEQLFEKRKLELSRRLDYNGFVDHIIKTYQFSSDYVIFPGATPAWDNTARRGENAFLLKNADPEKFSEWLTFIANKFEPPSEEENFVFINAWNEWAEGNHLEPCQKWGRKYLEAVKNAFVKNA